MKIGSFFYQDLDKKTITRVMYKGYILKERAVSMDAQKEKTLEKSLLYHVGSLPKLMVHNHMRDNLAAYVLHELCSKNGFGLGKAAYFVNNPDFRCLKGVGGYHNSQAYEGTPWENEAEFVKHLEQAVFHNKVREFQRKHLENNSGKLSLDQLQEEFEFDNTGAHIWNLKHDNQGIFLFEKKDHDALVDDHLLDFVQYLGFCPVY